MKLNSMPILTSMSLCFLIFLIYLFVVQVFMSCLPNKHAESCLFSLNDILPSLFCDGLLQGVAYLGDGIGDELAVGV